MINADKPHLWKPDMIASVTMYNEWFLEAAPRAYRDTRAIVVDQVNDAFMRTSDLGSITPFILKTSPAIVSTLRMSTAPPIARDRLVGLSRSTSSLIKTMESGGIPPRMSDSVLDSHLERICLVLIELLDMDLFPWLNSKDVATDGQVLLASTVVADRLCGSVADPIVRNAQEQRQLTLIGKWLDFRGYVKRSHSGLLPIQAMPQGTY